MLVYAIGKNCDKCDSDLSIEIEQQVEYNCTKCNKSICLCNDCAGIACPACGGKLENGFDWSQRNNAIF